MLMDKIIVNNNEYELIKNNKDGFNEDEFYEKCTDYFYDYDYIVGDYAYNKLRLKGFYDSSNPKVKELNDIKHLDTYINEYCAYGCRYYVLRKKK
jgi:uncharacterized protein YutD